MQSKYPTFIDSPAFKWFKRDNGDLIDAIDAQLYWSESGGNAFSITNFAIAYMPRRKIKSDHPLWKANANVFNKETYKCSSGNCDSEWMKQGDIIPKLIYEDSDPLIGFSPIGDFEYLKYIGFENIDFAKQAIQEFAFIKECEWARDSNIVYSDFVKAK